MSAPVFARAGVFAMTDALQWIEQQPCKGEGFCEGDPDLGPARCWRHARAWDSAQRIIRAQRRGAA